MKNLTLVILAAGMGSRFGGLKQIEPVGPSGEFIVDYSIYDAKKAGFNKIVFVIKKENYKDFIETIGKRIGQEIEICYAFQELNNLPNGYKLKEDRIKPWGTAHAIYCAKDYVDGNFAIINADDFYGFDAYKVLADYLVNLSTDNKEHFCMVGYKVSNTLTENGAVKRGVCEEQNGYLSKITESKVENVNNEIVVSPLSGEKSFKVDKNSLVSMNMFGFTNNIFDYIENQFPLFLDKNKNNLLTCEYLIPEIVFLMIKSSLADVKILTTNAKWYGITYKDDKKNMVDAITKMINNNSYPKKLWK